MRPSRVPLGCLLAVLFLSWPAFAQPVFVPESGMIVARVSGMCAQTRPRWTAEDVQLWQGVCRDAPRQNWRFRSDGADYVIENVENGMCLAVVGSSQVDGDPVVQQICDLRDGQRWTLRPRGEWVEIASRVSAKCLNVDAASIEAGMKLIVWSCQGDDDQIWTLVPDGPRSRWSMLYDVPLVPVAAANLRNGKVLLWSAFDRFVYGGDNGQTYTAIFDPATGHSTERLVTNTGHDMFCPGTAALPDGRILVNGGSSSAKTSIYDPATNSWTSSAVMKVPRGYQADAVLSNGRVLTVGGSWSGGEGGKIGETWAPDAGWRRLRNVAAEPLSDFDPAGIYRADNHMWLFGAADGYAFKAGPSSEMHWIDTHGPGRIISAGPRGDDAYAMNGNAVMFDAARILTLGGAPAYEERRASDSAYVIEIGGGPDAPVVVQKQAAMAFPRAFHNSVVLPTGEVVVIGGMNYPIAFSDERSMLIPEIWSPETGRFSPLAPMRTPRNYHSVALLLTDGRVLAGGGGLCGSCETNHPNVQILTPPYLIGSSGGQAIRPIIFSAPASAARGALIDVETDVLAASFALVRLGAVTHSVNNDQRRAPLTIENSNGTLHHLRLPSNKGVLIAGDWMLFAMTSAGAPSIAKIIRIT